MLDKTYFPHIAEIKDKFGDVESATIRLTTAETQSWYIEHGIAFEHVQIVDKDDRLEYSYQKAE